MAQTCSGVNLPGAPGRGASLKRSATLWEASASRQRLRQVLAVSVTLTPSAASKTIRARSASFCGVECARLRVSVPGAVPLSAPPAQLCGPPCPPPSLVALEAL